MPATRPDVSPSTPSVSKAGPFRPLRADTAETIPQSLTRVLDDVDPDTRLYALLDGARLTNLPELLATSDVPHRCLYTGKAAENLGAVAPWLAQLPYDNTFTRNLFTQDPDRPAHWHYWHHEPGLFFASQTDLDTMHAHLRRFTRLADSDGTFYQVRFHEPDFLSNYLRATPDGEIATRLFHHRGAALVDALICVDRLGDLWLATPPSQAPAGPIRITPKERAAISGAHAISADRRAAKTFLQSFPDLLAGETIRTLAPRIALARRHARALGLEKRQLVGTFIVLACVYLPDFFRENAFEDYWAQSPKEPEERFTDFLAVLKLDMSREQDEWDWAPWW